MRNIVFATIAFICIFWLITKYSSRQKAFSVELLGDTHRWSFDFRADPKYWQDWESDGLQVYQKIMDIPEIIIELKLTGLWIAFHHLFYK
jgi:hypothetical protein